MLPSPRTVVRREGGIFALERALQRRGFAVVAGADEAGRGACAGPLVAAAAILPATRRGEVPGLADSKLLTPLARDRVYAEVVARAQAYAVVIIPAADVDRRGLQVCNLDGMRRALAALSPAPDYVLTDGFGVSGLGTPGLAVWKGDRVAACIAAASVVAKVTRDRIMVEMDEMYPGYGFADHKGYSTDEHAAALARHGPCPEHRYSYVNVAAVSPVEVVGSAQRRRRSTVSVAVDESLALRMRTTRAGLGEACEPRVWPSGEACEPRVRPSGDACEPRVWPSGDACEPSGDQGREGRTG